MKIKKVDYRDMRTGWHLENACLDDFNLLVGVSGVGKTKTVQALRTLQSFALGSRELEAARWVLEFEEGGHEYRWEGATEAHQRPADSFSKDTENGVRFVQESLLRDAAPLLTRAGDDVELRGNRIPGLSARESCIRLLENDVDIRGAKRGFLYIAFADGNAVPREGTKVAKEALNRKLVELKELPDREPGESFVRGFVDGFTLLNERTALHIYLKQQLLRANFDRSVEQFRAIFPSVLDVKAAFADELRADGRRDLIQVAIRETGSSEWITQPEISSGMLRVLLHIFELEAAPRGSVTVVDEFENSLGDNCLSEMTNLMLSRAPEIQFILTSHHPYVINKIPIETWKLVQRTGSTVTLRSARDIPALMGRSRHDAFIRLINLPEFEDGIAIGAGVEPS